MPICLVVERPGWAIADNMVQPMFYFVKADDDTSGSRVSQIWMWGGQKGEKEAGTATLIIIILQIHVLFLQVISNCWDRRSNISM